VGGEAARLFDRGHTGAEPGSGIGLFLARDLQLGDGVTVNGVTVNGRTTDVAIEIVRDRDGSVVVFPALPAEGQARSS
jgi:hypothetical protein